MANLESSIGDRGLNIVTSISLIKTYWARIAKVSGSLPQKRTEFYFCSEVVHSGVCPASNVGKPKRRGVRFLWTLENLSGLSPDAKGGKGPKGICRGMHRGING